MNSFSTKNDITNIMDDMIKINDVVLEQRRDQVMSILNGFSSPTNIKVEREDIDLGSYLILSSELVEEYNYLKDIPFIITSKFVERNEIIFIKDLKELYYE